jgi:putative transposase
MSEHIHKSHNVSLLLYHVVCPTKYRRAVIDPEVDVVLKSVCFDISNRYEISFVEIGADRDHVHFLVQSVPTMSPYTMVQRIKSITAKEIFRRAPQVRKQLWGGAFWSSGYYINTVGQHGNEATIKNYIANQGRLPEYEPIHRGPINIEQICVEQLELF